MGRIVNSLPVTLLFNRMQLQEVLRYQGQLFGSYKIKDILGWGNSSPFCVYRETLLVLLWTLPYLLQSSWKRNKHLSAILQGWKEHGNNCVQCPERNSFIKQKVAYDYAASNSNKDFYGNVSHGWNQYIFPRLSLLTSIWWNIQGVHFYWQLDDKPLDCLDFSPHFLYISIYLYKIIAVSLFVGTKVEINGPWRFQGEWMRMTFSILCQWSRLKVATKPQWNSWGLLSLSPVIYSSYISPVNIKYIFRADLGRLSGPN